MYPREEEKIKEVIYIGAEYEVLIHKPYKEKFKKDEKVKVTSGMAKELIPLKEFKGVYDRPEEDKKEEKKIVGGKKWETHN